MMARKKLKKEGEADEERLQTVVAGRVSLNAVKIAKMLVAKAMEGHIGSIRMLLKLCEPRVLRNRPVKRRKPTLAMQLAVEEQWQDWMEDSEEEERIG